MQNCNTWNPLVILMLKNAPRVPSILLTVKKTERENLILFFLSFFFFLMHNSKVCNISERSANQMTALLSEIYLFLVRAACKLKSVSYGSKYTLRTFFYMPFCVYLHAQLENKRSYNDALPNKWLIYYWKCLFTWLELYVRYDQRVMDPNIHHNYFSIWHFGDVQFLC